MDVFQFGTVWGHSEEDERASRAGLGGQSEVPCSPHYHKPLHVTAGGKLTHCQTVCVCVEGVEEGHNTEH